VIVIPQGTSDLAVRIIRRAQQDIPIVENPPSSNRSPEIDALCKRYGVPLASYWCGLWASAVWEDSGAEIPPIDNAKGWHPAIVQTWYEWALETFRFTSHPALGSAALYRHPGEKRASHIGACVVATSPVLLDLEGNTSLSGYSRNGELTGLKPVDLERLLGYVSPVPLLGSSRMAA
jgi:hypothetical protein